MSNLDFIWLIIYYLIALELKIKVSKRTFLLFDFLYIKQITRMIWFKQNIFFFFLQGEDPTAPCTRRTTGARARTWPSLARTATGPAFTVRSASSAQTSEGSPSPSATGTDRQTGASTVWRHRPQKYFSKGKMLIRN